MSIIHFVILVLSLLRNNLTSGTLSLNTGGSCRGSSLQQEDAGGQDVTDIIFML